MLDVLQLLNHLSFLVLGLHNQSFELITKELDLESSQATSNPLAQISRDCSWGKPTLVRMKDFPS
jgi:hypothetical protein